MTDEKKATDSVRTEDDEMFKHGVMTENLARLASVLGLREGKHSADSVACIAAERLEQRTPEARITVDRHRLGYRLNLPNVWRHGVLVNDEEARELLGALRVAVDGHDADPRSDNPRASVEAEGSRRPLQPEPAVPTTTPARGTEEAGTYSRNAEPGRGTKRPASDYGDEARTHTLKCWPFPFEDLKAGRKRFEYRRFDRDYRVGDKLSLGKWEPTTGRYADEPALDLRVTYLLPGGTFGVPEGHCVMSVEPWTETALVDERQPCGHDQRDRSSGYCTMCRQLSDDARGQRLMFEERQRIVTWLRGWADDRTPGRTADYELALRDAAEGIADGDYLMTPEKSLGVKEDSR